MGEIQTLPPRKRGGAAIDAPPGFERGAVVELKSGSNRMTVREAVKGFDAPMVRVDWHDEGAPVSFDYFCDQLVRIETPDAEEGAA